MMGSAEACETDWGLMPALPLAELLKDLSVEEQVRLQSDPHERGRIPKRCGKNLPQPPQMHLGRERQRDNCITSVARHALRHYNARHPDAQFDAVRSLMQSSVHFKGELWYHINFWSRDYKSNKIKRFFAEVHYKQPTSISAHSNPPVLPESEVRDKPSPSSSVCSDQAISVSEAHVRHRRPASSSVCPVPNQIPIFEVCTIIEEPLGRYRRSCAFCPGSRDILHPRGDRKFVCGNDKDRMVQQVHFPQHKRRELPCPSATVKRK